MMEFQTKVNIAPLNFQLEPFEKMLFVGSCFADSIGQRFKDNKFRATVNPYGVMYNPASVLHTVEQWDGDAKVAFLTLGTNHVYRLKESGEIVDNCQKRPQALFIEEELTVEDCAGYLMRTVKLLQERNPDVHVVMTVSPIRYRKYGYHKNQLSKATLLLAIDRVINDSCWTADDNRANCPEYFPAYEIVMDELRDYRFYAPDMLHPSEVAIDYIWQQLSECCFSPATLQFLQEWAPVKAALGHRPFNPESPEYQTFIRQTEAKADELMKKYNHSKTI